MGSNLIDAQRAVRIKTFPIPAASVAPAITGTTEMGETLTASDGTWNFTGTITKQWYRNGVAISGETGDTYTLTLADIDREITCRVSNANPRSTNYVQPSAGSFWRRGGAVLDVDFTNGNFYWNGAERALTDLTSESGGAYSLSGYGLGFVDTAWVQVEYSSPVDSAGAANMDGNIFSWTTAANQRVELAPRAIDTYGNDYRIYISPGNPTANFDPVSLTSKDAEGGSVWKRNERRKTLIRIKSSETTQYMPDNGDLRSGAFGAGTLGVPSKIGFGMNARFGGSAFTGTLHRVTIYNTDLSTPEIIGLGKSGTAPPVHAIGDSFLNNYGVGTRFMRLCDEAGKVVPFSQDGVGGTTLEQIATRWEAYAGTDREKWWDSTLIVSKFGNQIDVALEIAALERILALLTHDRWVYMQPAPSATLSPVTPLPAADATMKAFCGDHWVSTLPEAWAESDGSVTDENQIALGRWPVSMTVSASDFHPNDNKGHPFIARRWYSALDTRLYI